MRHAPALIGNTASTRITATSYCCAKTRRATKICATSSPAPSPRAFTESRGSTGSCCRSIARGLFVCPAALRVQYRKCCSVATTRVQRARPRSCRHCSAGTAFTLKFRTTDWRRSAVRPRVFCAYTVRRAFPLRSRTMRTTSKKRTPRIRTSSCAYPCRKASPTPPACVSRRTSSM